MRTSWPPAVASNGLMPRVIGSVDRLRPVLRGQRVRLAEADRDVAVGQVAGHVGAQREPDHDRAEGRPVGADQRYALHKCGTRRGGPGRDRAVRGLECRREPRDRPFGQNPTDIDELRIGSSFLQSLVFGQGLRNIYGNLPPIAVECD